MDEEEVRTTRKVFAVKCYEEEDDEEREHVKGECGGRKKGKVPRVNASRKDYQASDRDTFRDLTTEPNPAPDPAPDPDPALNPEQGSASAPVIASTHFKGRVRYANVMMDAGC